IKRVADYLTKLKPDVVHTHLFAGDFWGGMAAKKAKVPRIVSTKHDILNEGYWRNKLGRKARRSFDKVIAISKATQEFLIKVEKVDVEKTELIYNGVEVNRFYKEKPELFESTKLNVGAVGRLSKEKGHKHLIRACIFIKNIDWRLTLVGDGAMRKELEHLVKLLSVEDKVKFTGLVDDVREYLDDMDVFVLPSVSEGLSLSIIEAALAGKFIIATEVGGVPEIITHKDTGLLFKPKNIEELVKHLNWVKDNKGKAANMAKSLQAQVMKKFDINKIVKQYEEMYENLTD
ncbi:MAG: glycosyltransferase family 4 protein, partial [Methylococcales bacterium]|nr:glycosyltransferase family 4 protein [Methylococcales bacterium]